MKIYVDKLPKNCLSCPLHINSLIASEDFCSVNGKSVLDDEYFNKRPGWCPLIEKDVSKIERELRIAQEGCGYLRRKIGELKEQLEGK